MLDACGAPGTDAPQPTAIESVAAAATARHAIAVGNNQCSVNAPIPQPPPDSPASAAYLAQRATQVRHNRRRAEYLLKIA
jgi:hypothetical protein